MLDLIFPTECVVCRKTGPDLCPACIRGFTEAKPQTYSWISSLWNYHDPSVELLMRYLKNTPNRRVVRILGPLLAAQCPTGPFVIIPIPISASRFRERGYNQALLIAQPVARLLRQPILTMILFKQKQTKKQGTTASREERIENMQGAFGVQNISFIKDKTVLLIDDITTTGSTLSEAQKALAAAGATRVFAITIAN